MIHIHQTSRMVTKAKQILLISSSRVHGYEFLEYVADDIKALLSKNNVSTVTFIPFASTDHQAYIDLVTKTFNNFGFKVSGLLKTTPIIANQKIDTAEAIFIGGGNTFLLLNTLYELDLMLKIRTRVLTEGVPYIGSSAGSNVACMNINNTNDMPIIQPPSFVGLQLVPFNINPHYIDPDKSSTHKGETREERIQQYHQMSSCVPNVLGLREGSHIVVDGDTITLKGFTGGRLFRKGTEAIEIATNSDISYLGVE